MPTSSHLSYLLERCPELSPIRGEIEAAYFLLRDSLAGGGKLLLCGNGGSAADADHWAGELLKGFKSLRPLKDPLRSRLPETLASGLQGGLAAIPLPSFTALISAFANDVDASLAYAQLVVALGKPGDVLVGISTSGNSKSVCAAAETAKAMGLRVLGLTGSGGGRLAPLCDVALRAPSDETFRIQEFHLPIYHALCLMLEDQFFPAG